MHLSSIIIVVVVIVCIVPPSCITAARPDGSDVIGDASSSTVSASDGTYSVELLATMLRSYLCKKQLTRDKLDIAAVKLKVSSRTKSPSGL